MDFGLAEELFESWPNFRDSWWTSDDDDFFDVILGQASLLESILNRYEHLCPDFGADFFELILCKRSFEAHAKAVYENLFLIDIMSREILFCVTCLLFKFGKNLGFDLRLLSIIFLLVSLYVFIQKVVHDKIVNVLAT